MTASAPAFQLILIGGGVRSGKSRFALELAEGLGRSRTFIATAEGLDDEMATRIARHRGERPASFTTIEEPVALPECLRHVWLAPGAAPAASEPGGAGGPGLAPVPALALAPPDVLVVDCLTLWVSNLLVRGDSEVAVTARIRELVEVLRARRSHVILVSNEVGMGLVPETAIGRAFRDLLGHLHQLLAAEADQIFLGVMGLLLRVSPPPIERVCEGAREGAREQVGRW
jgi:adenosylcobinamide kinase/adenosylcobinamide-phosphate guanylyltransferase